MTNARPMSVARAWTAVREHARHRYPNPRVRRSIRRRVAPIKAAGLVSGLAAALLAFFPAEPVFAQATGSPEVAVPASWSLKPSFLGGNVRFRLVFITSGTLRANSSVIGDYDNFVRRAAASGHRALVTGRHARRGIRGPALQDRFAERSAPRGAARGAGLPRTPPIAQTRPLPPCSADGPHRWLTIDILRTHTRINCA